MPIAEPCPKCGAPFVVEKRSKIGTLRSCIKEGCDWEQLAPEPQPQATAARPMAPVTASEAQAQASCPSDIVVWLNTKSGIYHFKGNHNYGNTKQGTYMCEPSAKAAGDRAAENEKRP